MLPLYSIPFGIFRDQFFEPSYGHIFFRIDGNAVFLQQGGGHALPFDFFAIKIAAVYFFDAAGRAAFFENSHFGMIGFGDFEHLVGSRQQVLGGVHAVFIHGFGFAREDFFPAAALNLHGWSGTGKHGKTFGAYSDKAAPFIVF